MELEALVHGRSPPWNTIPTYSDIVSDIPPGSIYIIYMWPYLCIFLFYSDILSEILSGIYFDINILSDILSGIYSDILSGRYSDILSGIYSDILFGIFSGILSGICSNIVLWHSFLAFLSGIYSRYSDIISGILSDILSGVWLRSRQCPLRSGGRSWGPAVPTELWS